MINLIPYSEDCFEFFQEVVSRKYNTRKDPTYKDRIATLESRIEVVFQEYLDLIDNENLEDITALGFTNEEKQDLLLLYKFKSKALQELKILLTTIDGRKFNTCQMCTVEPVGSFDHIVPKEDYPEHSVNPINLFPSCLNCNSIKGRRWLSNGQRMFLNLFFDLIPDVEYLKIDFQSYPIPDFSIDGALLPPDKELIISSHYKNLDLFKRYRENSNEVIDPVITQAKSLVPRIGLEEFRDTVQESVNDMQMKYGRNHWKSLLKLALVNHADFDTLLVDNPAQ